ncbi:MAG: amino acid permease [Hydrogenibacillus schlegelii]|nr:amino acid permease [Hydrogenibacillus schlegelii]
MSPIWRKKTVEEARELAEEREYKLKRELGPLQLMLLVLGSTIGAGIFVLPGTVAHHYAGPGVIASFALSGLVTIAVGLAYVEFASMVPVAGSAYTYAYVALGEILAWIVGWDLIFEFTVITSTVAVGWSGYVVEIARSAGLSLPEALTRDLAHGGVVNLPAVLGLLLVASIALAGIRLVGQANAFFTWIKIAAILFFIAVGIGYVDPVHWQPFAPYGLSGILTGAALVFFAYTGFDGVTTVLEEVKNPQRTIPIALLGGLILLTLFYVVVAAVMLGMVPYTELDVPDPAAYALARVGIRWGSALLSVAVVFGLIATMLGNGLSATRILFALGRDGLLPPAIARVHPTRRVPTMATVLVFGTSIILAGFLSIGELAELANIGGLSAFLLTTVSVVVMRFRRPDEPRVFKVPALWLFAPIGIVGSLVLIASLPAVTFVRFGLWLLLGLVVYFGYGIRHARIAR